MAKKLITNKQQTILTFIFTFRFINSKQIQTLMNHKDHRRINSWLRDLTEKGYIERDFKPIFGTLTKPAVYFLGIKGRDYIRHTYGGWQEKYLTRLQEDRKRSKAFRIRCQIVADCYLILFEKDVTKYLEFLNHWLTEGPDLLPNKFYFFTPSYYEEVEFTLLKPLKPDAYCYALKTTGITHMMIYDLDAYIPRMMLRYSLQRIFRTLDEENWEDEAIESLLFYFVCPNNMIIIYLKRLLPSFLEGYYGSKELIFHFATRNQLYKRQKNKANSTGWIAVSSTEY